MLIGPSRSLVGVLTLPEVAASAGCPTIVIVNTGIVHRVGNHRMYVTLARQLARASHIVLRFDLSGLGDSSWRADDSTPEQAAHADIRDAIDWLVKKCGASDFVVIGLCAGSDVALGYGHTDPRVVGLVLLDPTVPPTPRFYTNYIRERIHRPQSWLTFIRGEGRLRQDLVRLATAIARRPWSIAAQPVPEAERKDGLEMLYRHSLARGVQFFVALTGGDLAWRQTYREQILDAFPGANFGDKLRLEYFANSEHTFAPAEDRARLNGMIADWLRTTRFRDRP